VGVERERLYQLVRVAEWSYCIRDTQRQYEVGRILQQFPYPFDVLGSYYEAQYLNRKGLYEVSTKLLERVYEQGPEQYRARALQTLAARDEWRGKIGEALRFRVEAIKIGDPFTSLEAQLGVAICKSVNGDHRGAIRQVEHFLPMVKALYGTHPLYFDYLNSLAVELGEVGRIQEAQNVCQITLASPYTFAYPEWRETGNEIALRGYKSRSSVSVIQIIPGNILYLPEPSPVSDASIKSGRARLFSLEKWKEEKMVKEPNGDDKKLPEDMSVQDMAMGIVEMITNNKDDEEKLRKLFEAALKIFSEK
jgi:tetratricopeptide (TPR) repeat protein